VSKRDFARRSSSPFARELERRSRKTPLALLKRMGDAVRGGESGLTVVRFPPYAPELNPVEYLWSNARATYLANYLPDDLVELSAQVKRHARHLRRHPDLPRAFLKHSGLF